MSRVEQAKVGNRHHAARRSVHGRSTFNPGSERRAQARVTIFERSLKKMKPIHLAILLCLSCLDAVGEDKTGAESRSEFQDPRRQAGFHAWIEDGEKRQEIRLIDRSILIICWTPDHSKGDTETYEISGLQGRHSEAHAKRFLDEFYAAEQSEPKGQEASNVIIVGTGWGSGIVLREKLEELSQKHSFSVFYTQLSGVIGKGSLIEEPEWRLSLIRKAHERAMEKEPATTGPAIRSEPK